MKYKNNMLNKDLRVAGKIIKIINPTFTEKRLRFFNKLSSKITINGKDDQIEFNEAFISRKDGSQIRICIFKPKDLNENVPGIIWLHGGGYAIGAPEMGEAIATQFINENHCIVIAPDYRMSIQAPYPAALEDSYDALLWMKSHAKELRIRENQLMIGGESAGGGLTAALSLYARDKKEVAIAFQMPLYPMIDDRMTSESATNNNAPLWNSKSNYNGWKLYLGDLFETSNVPYYAAAARAKDYRNLPPTVTYVGELEPFRDETIQYIENLKKAGVPVDFKIYKGCFHAFDTVCPKAEISKIARLFLIKSFKFAVDHYFAEQSHN